MSNAVVMTQQTTQRLVRTATLPSGTTFSAGAWIYFTNLPGSGAYPCIFGLSESGGGQALIGANGPASGCQLYGYVQGSFDTGATNDYFTTGQWYYIGIGYDSTSCIIYAYDENADSWTTQITFTSPGSFSPDYINFGANSGDFGDPALDGRYSFMRVWSGTKLTLAQFQAEAASATPVITANLWVDLPPDSGSGNRGTDHSGNSNTFTEEGTLTDAAGPDIGAGAIEEAITLTRHLAATVSNNIEAGNSATLTRHIFAAISDDTGATEETASAARHLGVSASANVVIEETITLNVIQRCAQPVNSVTIESAQIDISKTVSISANAVFDETITLAKTIAAGTSSQISVVESITVSRYLAQAPAQNGVLLDALTVARYLDILTSGQKSGTEEAINLARALGVDVSGLGELFNSISLPRALDISIAENGVLSDGLTLAKSQAMTAGIEGTEEAITLSRSMGISADNVAILAGVIALTRLHGVANSSQLTALEAMLFQKILVLSASVGSNVDELALAESQSWGLELVESKTWEATLVETGGGNG